MTKNPKSPGKGKKIAGPEAAASVSPTDSQTPVQPKNHKTPGTTSGHFARVVAGYTLFVIGLVGLFLPVLQGVACIMAALLLLRHDNPWLQKALDRLARAYPEQWSRVEKWDKKLAALMQRIGL